MSTPRLDQGGSTFVLLTDTDEYIGHVDVYRAGARTDSLNPHHPHQPPDSFAIDLSPSELHFRRDSAIAIKGTGSVNFVNQAHIVKILL